MDWISQQLLYHLNNGFTSTVSFVSSKLLSNAEPNFIVHWYMKIFHVIFFLKRIFAAKDYYDKKEAVIIVLFQNQLWCIRNQMR